MICDAMPRTHGGEMAVVAADRRRCCKIIGDHGTCREGVQVKGKGKSSRAGHKNA